MTSKIDSIFRLPLPGSDSAYFEKVCDSGKWNKEEKKKLLEILRGVIWATDSHYLYPEKITNVDGQWRTISRWFNTSVPEDQHKSAHDCLAYFINVLYPEISTRMPGVNSSSSSMPKRKHASPTVSTSTDESSESGKRIKCNSASISSAPAVPPIPPSLPLTVTRDSAVPTLAIPTPFVPSSSSSSSSGIANPLDVATPLPSSSSSGSSSISVNIFPKARPTSTDKLTERIGDGSTSHLALIPPPAVTDAVPDAAPNPADAIPDADIPKTNRIASFIEDIATLLPPLVDLDENDPDSPVSSIHHQLFFTGIDEIERAQVIRPDPRVWEAVGTGAKTVDKFRI